MNSLIEPKIFKVILSFFILSILSCKGEFKASTDTLSSLNNKKNSIDQPPPDHDSETVFRKNTNYTGFISEIDGQAVITNTVNLTVTNGEVMTPLINAIRAATPGSRIIIPDGIYQNQIFNFSKAGCPRGLSNRPIIIQATTPGGVIFKGTSSFLMCGAYIVVQGISFIGPNAQENTTDASVPFKLGTSFNNVFRVCDYCALRKVLIDDYSVLNNPDLESTWIYISYDKTNVTEQTTSKGIEISDSRFINKKNLGVILYWSASVFPAAHHIYRNYFSRPEPTSKKNNGLEAIRAADSYTSANACNSIIEHNVFERSNGDAEDVSIKCHGNIVRYNTFINSMGTLSVRIGKNNIFEGNYFIASDTSKSGGIRISDENNLAIGNHFQGLRYGGENLDPRGSNQMALGLYNGDGQACSSATYCRVIKAFVVGNSFYQNDTNIVLGAAYKDTRTVPPISSVLANNLFDTTGMQSHMIYNRNANLDGFSIEGNFGKGTAGVNLAASALDVITQLPTELRGELDLKVPTAKKDLEAIKINRELLQRLGLAPDLIAKIKMLDKNIYQISLPLTSSDVGQTQSGY